MTWQTRLKIAWVRSVDAGTALFLAGLQRFLFHRLRWPTRETAVRRILVFRFGNIGDTLVALPVFDAIRRRFPSAHICLLTSPGPSGLPGAPDILPAAQWFDEYLSYTLSDIDSGRGRMNLLRCLRRPRFDLFINCSELLTLRALVRNMIFARLSGFRYVSGFQLHHQP